MSTSEIKGLRPGNKFDPSDTLATLQNGFGSAPVIWSSLYDKYVGIRMWMLDDENLWPLWKDPRLPRHQRAVLGMTYDRAYIERRHFAQAAADLRQFLEDFPPIEGNVNHLGAMIEQLESPSNADYEAIGFHWTSVNEDPWACRWRDEDEDEDEDEDAQETVVDEEENEELEPFDWSETWSLYPNVPQVEGQEAIS